MRLIIFMAALLLVSTSAGGPTWASVFFVAVIMGSIFVRRAIDKRIDQVLKVASPEIQEGSSAVGPEGLRMMSFFIVQTVLVVFIAGRLSKVQVATVRKEIILSVAGGIGNIAGMLMLLLANYRRRSRSHNENSGPSAEANGGETT